MTKMKIEEEKIREETKENSRRVGKNSRNEKIQREKKREILLPTPENSFS